MNTAQQIQAKAKNASDAMIAAGAAQVSADQDWDLGMTVYTFADGSELHVCGAYYRATYYMCETSGDNGKTWMVASGERHATEALAESECEYWRDEEASISAEACEYRAARMGGL
jgi:hypothetical protein